MSDEKSLKKNSIWAYALIGAAGLGLLLFDMPINQQSGTQTVATVDGRDISAAQLNSAISSLQGQLPGLDSKILQEQALHQLIRQALLESHALSGNFTYPDSLLHAELKSEFGSDEAYKSWLRDRGISAASYQESLRQNGAIFSYYQTLASSAPTHSALLDGLLQAFAQSQDYTVIRLPLDAAAEQLNADDAAIEAWYQAHPDAFMSTERVAVRYFVLDSATLTPADAISDDDIASKRRQNEQRAGQYLIFDTRSDAEAAAAALASGEKSFADLAADINANRLAGESGDLPLQRYGAGIDPVVDDALFALENSGDVSPVISSDNFTAMILTLTQQQAGDNSDVAAQLAQERGAARYSELAEKAFDAALNNQPLNQIAELTGQAISEHADLTPGSGDDWLRDAKVQASLFGDTRVAVGKVAEPVEISSGRSVFYEVTARDLPELLPYADVRAKAETLWRTDEAGKQLDAQSAEIVAAWQQGQDVATLIAQYHGEEQHYQGINRLAPPEGISADLAHRLMQQSERVSAETADNGDRLITHLDAVHPGSVDDLPADLRELLGEQWRLTRSQQEEDAMTQWLQENVSVKIQTKNLPQP